MLIIKKFLKKLWATIKHYWVAPFVVFGVLIAWLIFRRKDAAYEVLQTRNNSYEAQMEAINRIHKEEVEKRNNIIEKYNKIVKELEEKYKADRVVLDTKKKKEVKKIIEKYHDKPDELAKMLAEKYNLTYIE